MDSKTAFLNSAILLDHRINFHLKEIHNLRIMADRLAAYGMGERVQNSNNGKALFETAIDRIIELEDKINEEVDELLQKKAAVREAVDSVSNEQLKMVLYYRYLLGYSVEAIANELGVNERTVYRSLAKAKTEIKIP
ncbi:MAG: sigma-70 family RNA polymerase sigma factor [Oscillospiraceae bacterium]|nr:sigma-70 family RNA polymerase sigma factor [Oscillospiraceae bacterium]